MGIIGAPTTTPSRGRREECITSGTRRSARREDRPLMRRLEKMEVEKREAQAIDLKAAEARSTCEECGEYGHVQKNCPEEAKMLDYMKKGEWIPPTNFRYGHGRPQFNASSSIQNSVPFRIQLKEFMEEQARSTRTPSPSSRLWTRSWRTLMAR